jgi:hypothetical protein
MNSRHDPADFYFVDQQYRVQPGTLRMDLPTARPGFLIRRKDYGFQSFRSEAFPASEAAVYVSKLFRLSQFGRAR